MASADGNASTPTSSMDTSPQLCTSGCGFFGNANTAGMCSKCYKETLAKAATQTPAPAAAAAAAAATTSPTPKPAPSPAPSPAAPSASVDPAPAPVPAAATPTKAAVVAARPESEDSNEEPPKKKQVNTSRCWTCNKKIGLLGFQCKCDYFFCSEHRYSDRHECAFDYKAKGKEQLSAANPTIAPSKIASM